MADSDGREGQLSEHSIRRRRYESIRVQLAKVPDGVGEKLGSPSDSSGRHRLSGCLKYSSTWSQSVDEYTMNWSDATRVEAAFVDDGEVPSPPDHVHQFGTLGRALWRERSLAWILALHPDVRNEEAQKIVEDLSAASRPIFAGELQKH